MSVDEKLREIAKVYLRDQWGIMGERGISRFSPDLIKILREVFNLGVESVKPIFEEGPFGLKFLVDPSLPPGTIVVGTQRNDGTVDKVTMTNVGRESVKAEPPAEAQGDEELAQEIFDTCVESKLFPEGMTECFHNDKAAALISAHVAERVKAAEIAASEHLAPIVAENEKTIAALTGKLKKYLELNAQWIDRDAISRQQIAALTAERDLALSNIKVLDEEVRRLLADKNSLITAIEAGISLDAALQKRHDALVGVCKTVELSLEEIRGFINHSYIQEAGSVLNDVESRLYPLYLMMVDALPAEPEKGAK